MLINFDYINTKFQQACQVLEIDKQPILRFEYEGNRSSRYEELVNEIIINLNEIDDVKNTVLPFIKIKLVKNIDIVIFILYHELAHCLQYQKFPKWFLNCVTEWKSFENNIRESIIIGEKDFKKYRELKFEKCADKIAYILFKKLEKINA